jgi:short-subunit dehydrogenase
MLLLSLRLRIEGSHILLTGASSGIGAALAAELTRRGARVAGVSRRAASGCAVSIQADLTVDAERERAVGEALAALGRVDILINNAGVGIGGPSWQARDADVRRMFELNFFAAVDLTRRLAPMMVERGSGLVVNIASIAAKVTLPWFTLYCASKAALEAYTRGLRMELGGTGAEVMLVCPGYIRTDFQSAILGATPPDRLTFMPGFSTTPEALAREIAGGIERDARTVLAPRVGWGLVALSHLLPGTLDSRLRGMMKSAGR